MREAGRASPAVKRLLTLALGKNQPFPVRLTFLVLLGMCLLVPALVGQIFREADRLVEYHVALNASFERRSSIRRVFSALQDAEIGQRGFVLTGREEFLRPYEQATRELPLVINALESALAGSVLEPAGRRLSDLASKKISSIEQTLTTYRRAGRAASVGMITQRNGQGAMDEIRQTVDEMVATENAEISRLARDVRRQATGSRVILLILFGSIIASVLIAAGAGLVHIANRRQIERELQEAQTTAQDAQRMAEEAQRAAEQANSAKSDFLATLSHEIRTPLHAVIGSTELMLDSNGLNPEQRRYVGQIQASGTAVLNLINDVLDLSKIEAGELELSAEPFFLEAMIDNVISIVQGMAQRKRIALRTTLDRRLPKTLLGDQTRIRQVLLNLLNNAIKFSDRGDVFLRVEHRDSSDIGERVVFSITDSGPGIPETERDRLFKRFSQIDRSGRLGGTGLGLSISKRLVERMGGEIGLESEIGRGSTFWFSLTLPTVEPDTTAQTDFGLAAVTRGGRILVVDDLDQNRDLAKKMLEPSGFSVELASSGAEAVAAARTKRFDLVLMDIQMDGMNGVEATKAIRQLHGDMATVPIIAMTANVLTHDVKEFLDAGMDDHLGKPFTRRQLLTRVAAWQGRRHSSTRSDTISPALEHDAQPTPEELISLKQMMGSEWVARGLSEFQAKIQETFLDTNLDQLDLELMARQAHILVARAGILGFSDLSQHCRALELACRTDNAVAERFREAKITATRAQMLAATLLRTHFQPGEEASDHL